jgi:hypothetical protein
MLYILQVPRYSFMDRHQVTGDANAQNYENDWFQPENLNRKILMHSIQCENTTFSCSATATITNAPILVQLHIVYQHNISMLYVSRPCKSNYTKYFGAITTELQCDSISVWRHRTFPLPATDSVINLYFPVWEARRTTVLTTPRRKKAHTWLIMKKSI